MKPADVYYWTVNGMTKAIAANPDTGWVSQAHHAKLLEDAHTVSGGNLSHLVDAQAEVKSLKAELDEMYIKREKKDREYNELYEQLTRTVTERNALQKTLDTMTKARNQLRAELGQYLTGEAYRRLPPQVQAYYTVTWHLDSENTQKLIDMLQAIHDVGMPDSVAQAITRAQRALQGEKV